MIIARSAIKMLHTLILSDFERKILLKIINVSDQKYLGIPLHAASKLTKSYFREYMPSYTNSTKGRAGCAG